MYHIHVELFAKAIRLLMGENHWSMKFWNDQHSFCIDNLLDQSYRFLWKSRKSWWNRNFRFLQFLLQFNDEAPSFLTFLSLFCLGYSFDVTVHHGRLNSLSISFVATSLSTSYTCVYICKCENVRQKEFSKAMDHLAVFQKLVDQTNEKTRGRITSPNGEAYQGQRSCHLKYNAIDSHFREYT